MRLRSTLLAIALVAFFGGLVDAEAQELYDWPSKDVPVLVVDDDQVFFIGKDKTVYRTFSWKGARDKDSRSTVLADVNADGDSDLVGAGRPTFVLDNNADPIWFDKKGCDHVAVADVAADEKRDIVCVRGRNVNVFTFDGQLIWQASVGARFDYCQAGDINGDLKADVECKHRGSDKYSRFDGTNGESLAAGVEGSEVTASSTDGPDPVGKSSLENASFDLDGDGTTEESVKVDGDAVVIQSRSKKKAIARLETGKPIAVLAKDLDGDKKVELVVLGEKNVFVVSDGGKKIGEFALNSRKYKRVPVAELKSVYANGFEDDAAAAKSVEALNDKLAACYSSQVRRNQFAGQGLVILEVTVNDKAKVENVGLTHTELADKGVVKCATKVLRKGDYPKSKAEKAVVNVRMFYTFRDE